MCAIFYFKHFNFSDIEEGVQKCFNLDDFDKASPGSVNQGSPVEHKKKTDLSKICGFQSYHHIIEKAIHCSPDKMLTLNQSNHIFMQRGLTSPLEIFDFSSFCYVLYLFFVFFRYLADPSRLYIH